MARRPPPETAPPDESLTDGLVVGLERYPRAGAAHSGPYPGIGLPAFRTAQAAHRRRYAFCRQHRPHRFAGRQLRPDHRFTTFADAHASRRNSGFARPRSRDDHRRRTPEQPVPSKELPESDPAKPASSANSANSANLANLDNSADLAIISSEILNKLNKWLN